MITKYFCQNLKTFSVSFSESSVDLDDSGSSSVYAQNLDLHLQTTDNADDVIK